MLVHRAGEPPSTWAGVLWDETKPEDTYQLLRKIQPAPESPTAAERTFTSGYFPSALGSSCCPMLASGLSTGGTIPVASPQVQLNPFSFTVSEEHDAQGNTCQKDSMAELGTEPRPSSPRTRYHSVAFPYVQDINLHGHRVYEGQAPSHGPQRQSSTCASPSLFLAFCSTQQRPKDIGTLTEYLSDRENGSKEKEKKKFSELYNEFFNLLS